MDSESRASNAHAPRAPIALTICATRSTRHSSRGYPAKSLKTLLRWFAVAVPFPFPSFLSFPFPFPAIPSRASDSPVSHMKWTG